MPLQLIRYLYDFVEDALSSLLALFLSVKIPVHVHPKLLHDPSPNLCFLEVFGVLKLNFAIQDVILLPLDEFCLLSRCQRPPPHDFRLHLVFLLLLYEHFLPSFFEVSQFLPASHL